MKAGHFEYRHQTLLHLLLVGAALATYLAIPDDVVWATVRGHPSGRALERLAFGVGALIMIGSAVLETWGKATRPSERIWLRIARLLLALVVGLLLPLPGTLLLLTGEAFLVFRLLLYDRATAHPGTPLPGWWTAFRTTCAKWGLAASMILFTWTLQDRIAEIGAGLTVLLWFALNSRPSSAA